jgi:hypothetical protein
VKSDVAAQACPFHIDPAGIPNLQPYGETVVTFIEPDPLEQNIFVFG